MFSLLKKILPNTLLGKSLFLLIICRVIGVFVFSCFGLIYKIWELIKTNGDGFEPFFFNAEHSEIGVFGAIVALLNSAFFTYLQIFLVGGGELAIVWMIVYCCFRMARNGALSAMSFFWISLITLGIEHLSNVFITIFSPEAMSMASLESAIPMLTVFGVLTWLAHWVFLQNPSSDISEKSKEYFARVRANFSGILLLMLVALATIAVNVVLVILN